MPSIMQMNVLYALVGVMLAAKITLQVYGSLCMYTIKYQHFIIIEV